MPTLSTRGLPAPAPAHWSTLESAYLVATPGSFVLHCVRRRTRTVWSRRRRSVHGRAPLGRYPRHPSVNARATRWRALTTRLSGTAAKHERRIGRALLGSTPTQSGLRVGCWTWASRSRWRARYEVLRGSASQAPGGTNPVVYGGGLGTKWCFGNSRETVYRRPGGKRLWGAAENHDKPIRCGGFPAVWSQFPQCRFTRDSCRYREQSCQWHHRACTSRAGRGAVSNDIRILYVIEIKELIWRTRRSADASATRRRARGPTHFARDSNSWKSRGADMWPARHRDVAAASVRR